MVRMRSSEATGNTKPNCAGARPDRRKGPCSSWHRCGVCCPDHATAPGRTASASSTASLGSPAAAPDLRFAGTGHLHRPRNGPRTVCGPRTAPKAEPWPRGKHASPPLWRDLPGMNGVLLSDVASHFAERHAAQGGPDQHGACLGGPDPVPGLTRWWSSHSALPPEAKLHKGTGKHILRETFGHLLPAHGDDPRQERLRGPVARPAATVPWLRWWTGPLDKDGHPGAGLSLEAVNSVVRSLRSDPGTSQATLHAVLVYLSWWKRHGQH